MPKKLKLEINSIIFESRKSPINNERDLFILTLDSEVGLVCHHITMQKSTVRISSGQATSGDNHDG